MRVVIAVALAGVPEVVVVDLADGSSIRDALEMADVAARYPSQELAHVGIWGRRRDLNSLPSDGDRIECYRPLRADAKILRRSRALQHGRAAATDWAVNDFENSQARHS